jgi:site-specific recombinase XerD
MAGIVFAAPVQLAVSSSSVMRVDAAEPEQMHLFGHEVDMAKLRQRAAALMTGARSPNTQRAYAEDWADFCRWCESAGRQAMPAKPETLRLYLSHLIETGKAAGTVERRMQGVKARHLREGQLSPVDDETRAMLAGARRTMAPPVAKSAISVKQLRAMVAKLPRTPIGVRNHALLLLGFAMGARRSELSALNCDDVYFAGKGMRISIRKSKTDQEGKGRVVGVFEGTRSGTDPVKWMRYWLKVRGKEAGPLFVQFTSGGANTMERLGARSIALIVQAAVESIGLDRRRYGAHSLRAGLVTAAAEGNVPLHVIMQTTGHKNVQTLMKYVRPASVFSFNPLRAAL